MAKRQEAEDMSRLLADDVLGGALSRAAPRDLAVARCVCRAWRALIDGRRMLRLDFLPRSLAGLFIHYSKMPHSEFYARPSVDIAGYHLPRSSVLDHCNGLVLKLDGVLNPATGGWTPFPEPPPLREPGMVWPSYYQNMYLAFDPTVSSHFEVFVIPNLPPWYGQRRPDELPAEEYTRSSEWPPSPWKLKVFSSRAGRWDERCFIRENEGAETAADMMEDLRFMVHRNAVCWRRALYVHCLLNFIMRISLPDAKYRVIKRPTDLNTSRHMILHLDKSEKGVYFASLGIEDSRLRVWILDESSEQTQWMLKHDSVRGLAEPSLNLDQQVCGPWILESDYWDDQGNIKQAHEIEWNSDNDNGENILQTVEDGKYLYVTIEILAFHPFQEIVFLHTTRGRVRRGLAYHLNSFKLEDLGNMRPKGYGELGYVRRAVPYTPCLMGEFSEKLEFSDES